MSSKGNHPEKIHIYDTSLLLDAVHRLDDYQKTYLLGILPSRPGKKICPYFQRTKTCGFGLTCKFDHPLEHSPVSVSIRVLLNSLTSDDVSTFLTSANKIAESSFVFMNSRLDMELDESEKKNVIHLGLSVLRALSILVARLKESDNDIDEEIIVIGDATSYGRLVIFVDKIIVDIKKQLLDKNITAPAIYNHPDYERVLSCIEGISDLFAQSESSIYKLANSKATATDFASVSMRKDIDASIEYVAAQQLGSYNDLERIRDHSLRKLHQAFDIAIPLVKVENNYHIDDTLHCIFGDLTTFEFDQMSEKMKRTGFLLCPVGNCVTGLGFSSSVVDVVLFVPDDVDTTNFIRGNNTDPYTHTNYFNLVPLIDFCETILSKAGFYVEEIMKDAAVSTIRLLEPELGIKIHLHFNDYLMLMNTFLIRKYSNSDWRVKRLILAVEKWSNARSCRNCRNSSFSDHAWILLVIHFLQEGLDQPVLPNLLDKSSLSFKCKNDESCSQLLSRFFIFYGTNGYSSFRNVFNSVLVGNSTTHREHKDSDGMFSNIKPFEYHDMESIHFVPTEMEHVLNELRRSVYVLNFLDFLDNASADEGDKQENLLNNNGHSLQNIWSLLCEKLPFCRHNRVDRYSCPSSDTSSDFRGCGVAINNCSQKDRFVRRSSTNEASRCNKCGEIGHRAKECINNRIYLNVKRGIRKIKSKGREKSVG